jgi:hypothetical protein
VENSSSNSSVHIETWPSLVPVMMKLPLKIWMRVMECVCA